MSTIRVPPVLRQQTGGVREIEVQGATVGEALKALVQQHPALRQPLFNGGELHRFVNVYLNDEDISYLQKLDTPVRDSDTIVILPAMAGG
jgi:sulfur-carrier protein